MLQMYNLICNRYQIISLLRFFFRFSRISFAIQKEVPCSGSLLIGNAADVCDSIVSIDVIQYSLQPARPARLVCIGSNSRTVHFIGRSLLPSLKRNSNTEMNGYHSELRNSAPSKVERDIICLENLCKGVTSKVLQIRKKHLGIRLANFNRYPVKCGDRISVFFSDWR